MKNKLMHPGFHLFVDKQTKKLEDRLGSEFIDELKHQAENWQKIFGAKYDLDDDLMTQVMFTYMMLGAVSTIKFCVEAEYEQ